MYFLLFGTLIVLITNLYSYYNIKKEIISVRSEELLQKQEKAKHHIEMDFAEAISNLEQLANFSDFQKLNLVFDTTKTSKEEAKNTIDEILKYAKFSFSKATKFHYTNTQKKCLTFSQKSDFTVENNDSLLQILSFDKIKSKEIPEIKFIKNKLTYNVIISIPVTYNNNFKGILSVVFDKNWLDVLFRRTVNTEDDICLIVDDNIFSFGEKKEISCEENFFKKQAFLNKEEVFGEKNCSDGSYFLAFGKLALTSSSDLGIIVRKNSNEILTPLFEIRNRMLFLSLLMFFGIFSFSYLSSSRITTPLAQLKKALKCTVAGGEYIAPAFPRISEEIESIVDDIQTITNQRDKLTSKLTNSDDILKVLIETIPCGICITKNDKIVEFNNSLQEMTGIKTENFYRLKSNEIFEFKEFSEENFIETFATKNDFSKFPIRLFCQNITYKKEKHTFYIVENLSETTTLEKELSSSKDEYSRSFTLGEEKAKKEISLFVLNSLLPKIEEANFNFRKALFSDYFTSKNLLKENIVFLENIIFRYKQELNIKGAISLEYIGLTHSVKNFCREIYEEKQIDIVFEPKFDLKLLCKEIQIEIYRFAIVILTNLCEKNQRKKRIDLSLEEDELCVGVLSKGKFNIEALKEEAEIKETIKRMEHFSGVFSIKTSPSSIYLKCCFSCKNNSYLTENLA